MESEDRNELTLTGFIFGNIDSAGKLEDDFLDEEAKRHLEGLQTLAGLGTSLKEITDPGSASDDAAADVSSGKGEKAPDAVDYSDINEVAEETKPAESESEDRKLMPPPLVPGQPLVSAPTSSQQHLENQPFRPQGGGNSLSQPLADLLPPALRNVDPKSLFPDFDPGKVLRFSRLFKPTHKPHLWRRKKKTAEDEPVSRPAGGWNLKSGRIPRPDEVKFDDEQALLQWELPREKTNKEDEGIDECASDLKESSGDAASVDWRYGPARYWYDFAGIGETRESYQDLGWASADQVPALEKPRQDELDVERYLPISQQAWESDVFVEAPQSPPGGHSQNSQGHWSGWLPTQNHRTYLQWSAQKNPSPFMQRQHQRLNSSGYPTAAALKMAEEELQKQKGVCSIFPLENDQLVYESWEDDVILDTEKMLKKPKPKPLVLDMSDPNIIFSVPEDKDPRQSAEGAGANASKEKKEMRRSKMLLNKAGLLKDTEEEREEEQAPPDVNLDVFNLSNDRYYNPAQASQSTSHGDLAMGLLLQHSTPAMELQQPFFPTHLSLSRLRNFHRMPLKRYSHGPMSTLGPHNVTPLLRHIRKKEKEREQERAALGGGEMFFMRSPADLSGMDGDIILTEYSEEFPPLIMQVGMATKLKNYLKRKAGEEATNTFKYGELALAHTSPFLGNMQPGQILQGLENNLFRAPIYQHNLPVSDFLIIRNRQSYFIREVPSVYCVGQELPLIEVPGPNSKRANNFIRDFLQVFIYRLFWRSTDRPRRIKMEDIKKAFPSHSESSVRKRLKLCADFKRTGVDSNYWVLKPDFRLPPEEEIRGMISSEQCCAYYSMQAAEQRLKDAGYGEKSLFAEEGDNDDDSNKIDDEVRTAPWNTTRAYMDAAKGRCLLQLTGPADPTGCGEGFSYVKVPNKPQNKDESGASSGAKKTVTGTDADLRRLYLKDAKQILRKYGVPEHEIKKLSRWEVIDVVRTMSTEQAKSGLTGGNVGNKFARGNRFSAVEHHERYKEECQRIFDLQNKVLASDEVLSTDDESSSDDSDFEEMGKNIESMLSQKKTSSQLSAEKEEAERRELQNMLLSSNSDSPVSRTKTSQQTTSHIPKGARKLRITRTFVKENGQEYTRSELVKKSAVVEWYLRIRNKNDPNLIKQFTTPDEEQKEEMRKEKRRIQEQLRRLKRIEGKDSKRPFASGEGLSGKPYKKKDSTKDLKMKCGACGQIGHMRTNRECPYYGKPKSAIPSGGLSRDDTQMRTDSGSQLDDMDLIRTEDTKIIVSRNLIQHAEDERRKELTVKIPKTKLAEPSQPPKKKRRTQSSIHCDYLQRPHRTTHRRRMDPKVSMATQFVEILNTIKTNKDAAIFMTPVNSKHYPNYYSIIDNPMDIQTMREKARGGSYENREQFIKDITQIHVNSKIFNGEKDILTHTAEQLVNQCLELIVAKEERLMRLEKAINPLLDDDDAVGFSHILSAAIDRMKKVEKSWPFHTAVPKKLFKDYYDVIEHPMDVETIKKKIDGRKYYTMETFLADVELIFTNCERYNGKDAELTKTAGRIRDAAVEVVRENEEQLRELEDGIRRAQETALDAMESCSGVTSLNQDDISLSGHIEDDSIQGDPTPSESRVKFTLGEEEMVDVEGLDDSGAAAPVTSLAENSNSALHGDLVLSEDDDDEDAPNESGFNPASLDEDAVDQFSSGGVLQAGHNEDSLDAFDPSEFFHGLTTEPAAPEVENDLQVSDSDSDENDQNSSARFNMNEFLQ